MAKIDISGWGDFTVGDLFAVSRPKARSQMQYEDGDMPFVASGNFNNGVVKMCHPKDDEVPDKRGCITVSPLDGAAFYQPVDFLGRGGAGSAILILRNDNLTKLNGLFVSTILRAALTKFSYNDQINSKTILKQGLKLPVDSSGSPDWDYMESYMREILDEAEKSLDSLNQADEEPVRVDIAKWKRFHLYDDDLFEIDMGTKLDRVKMTSASPSVNFVGRANANNGVTDFVDAIDGIVPYDAGSMTVSLGGEYLGSCFVQPEQFYTSQNVIVLRPKWDMPFEIKQFIATMIFRESRMYYKAFIDELNRHIKTDFSFYLPVNENGSPDWDYMESYMRDAIAKAEASYNSLSEIVV